MQPAASIVILCSRLDLPGGTERAVVNTANLFVANGHSVTLLVLEEAGPSFYPLTEGIKIITASLHFGLTEKGNPLTRKLSFVQHIRQLRKLLSQLDAAVVISTDYTYTIAAWLAVGKSGKKIFSWEHHHFNWLQRSRFWQLLYDRTYPKIHAVVALNTKEQQLFQDAGCKAIVIPNFISPQAKAPLNTRTLLSVGWLIKRKGVDRIPAIAKKIFEKHPDWKWKIIGSGEEKEVLQTALHSQGLTSQVEIIEPFTYEMNATYQTASIFVMTSRFECFPMVLLESMSNGVPAVAFDCPTGPADIIIDGEDGRLIENENIDALADAIVELMDDEEKRKVFGAKAFENVKRFSPEVIYQKWKAVF